MAMCKEMDIDYEKEKEKDMVKNESEPRNVELHGWALELAAQVWCDPQLEDRVMDPEMAEVIANTIRKAVVTANDALVNSLHREQTARKEAENASLRQVTQSSFRPARSDMVICVEKVLGFLSGDLSYDNVSQAKCFLKGMLAPPVGSFTCSTCGCDCPSCGCASGCCAKCGCCKG